MTYPRNNNNCDIIGQIATTNTMYVDENGNYSVNKTIGSNHNYINNNMNSCINIIMIIHLGAFIHKSYIAICQGIP